MVTAENLLKRKPDISFIPVYCIFIDYRFDFDWPLGTFWKIASRYRSAVLFQPMQWARDRFSFARRTKDSSWFTTALARPRLELIRMRDISEMSADRRWDGDGKKRDVKEKEEPKRKICVRREWIRSGKGTWRWFKYLFTFFLTVNCYKLVFLNIFFLLFLITRYHTKKNYIIPTALFWLKIILFIYIYIITVLMKQIKLY